MRWGREEGAEMWMMGLFLYMSWSCGNGLAFGAAPLAVVGTVGHGVNAIITSASALPNQRLDDGLKFAEPRARRVLWKPRTVPRRKGPVNSQPAKAQRLSERPSL
jgi:hypothetical protein